MAGFNFSRLKAIARGAAQTSISTDGNLALDSQEALGGLSPIKESSETKINNMAAKAKRLNERSAALHQDIPHNAEQPPRPNDESHSVIGGKFNKFQHLRTLQDFKAECAKHNITFFVASYEYSTPRVFLAVPDYRKTDIMSELQYWLHARPELERALHKAIL